MHLYFITGLPRTRSTWFSAFLTNGLSYCTHEPSVRHKDTFGIKEELFSRPDEYKGIADCMVPFYFQPLAELVEGYRLVIIDRDPAEVKAGFMNWCNNNPVQEEFIDNHINVLQEKIKILKGSYEHLSFNFDELDDPHVIEQIWYYCIPGMPFDIRRWEMFNDFNVEPHFEKYMAKYNSENIKSISEVI